MTSAEASNRRGPPRAPVELRVEYKRLNAFISDYAKNISTGGTFIVTDHPLEVGTEFVFALTVPNSEAPLRFRGKVIWTTSPADASKANPAGMGIEFLYADDAERAQMVARVHGLVAGHLGADLAQKIISG